MQSVLTLMYRIVTVRAFANKVYLNTPLRDKTVQIEYIDVDSDVEVETNLQENSVSFHSRRCIYVN